MRLISLALALGSLAVAAPEYHSRRQALTTAIPQAVFVFFGGTQTKDDLARFYQEPNFYYLTGWKQPGATLLIDPHRAVLFLPHHNPEFEKFRGPQASPDDKDIAEVTGFDTVLPIERFESELHTSLENWPALYTTGDNARARLRMFAPLRDVQDARPTLARMRMKKSPAEIALLQRAADATVAAHRAAWKLAAPGKYEYQIAAAAQSVYLGLGCERDAYPPIAGSGPNGLYLHYVSNERRMNAGDLLLMDAGAECAGYTADVTRTIPVNGKFTARQRELYDIALGAEKAAIAAVKPGIPIAGAAPRSLNQVARAYINSHGTDLHGQPLGQYFTHDISHHIGLEVHDAADTTAPLQAGMVISIEPGIYIPEENIGIRIEDVVLVTEEGAQVLTAALPREAAEIERALAK
jgi:Xaa-Pro aminopeptidase